MTVAFYIFFIVRNIGSLRVLLFIFAAVYIIFILRTRGMMIRHCLVLLWYIISVVFHNFSFIVINGKIVPYPTIEKSGQLKFSNQLLSHVATTA